MSKKMTTGIQWEDATSYKRDEPRSTTEPRSFEFSANGVRVWVSCDHIYHRPGWCYRVFPMMSSEMGLSASNEATAKKHALEAAVRLARDTADDLLAFIDAAGEQP